MDDFKVNDDGFEDFEKLLQEFEEKVEDPMKYIEIGAKAFVNDVRRLPQPRSSVNKAGYTHILDTITYRRNRDEIETGWGKYYGPMLEKGAKTMHKEHPHMGPTFEKNKEKYYKKMTETFYR